jgi:hypothetical protein
VPCPKNIPNSLSFRDWIDTTSQGIYRVDNYSKGEVLVSDYSDDIKLLEKRANFHHFIPNETQSLQVINQLEEKGT